MSGEELGLWGSDYFAARPPVSRSSIVAAINLDMVGRAFGDTVYLTGQAAPRFAPAVKNVVGRTRGLIVLDEAALDRRYPGEFFDERSDHVNFRRRNIPALSLYTGTHGDCHETTDDPATLNYDGLSRIANLAYDLLVAVGNAARDRVTK